MSGVGIRCCAVAFPERLFLCDVSRRGGHKPHVQDTAVVVLADCDASPIVCKYHDATQSQ